MTSRTVLLLGATNKPERYAYLALESLLKHGHKVVPIHPTLKEVQGVSVVSDLSEVKEKIEDITLYVGPERTSGLIDKILAVRPERIIFNPGTENPALKKAAEDQGIKTLEACTLVMLSTNSFDVK